MKRELSQKEIDSFFQAQDGADGTAVACDFTRVDRISKSQLRAIHLLHEEFVRALSSSLSVYLRSFVRLTLVSIEQIPYSDVLAGVSTPTCIAYAHVAPYEATAMLEISPSLVATAFEILLGGAGTTPPAAGHKMTDIEKSVMSAFLKVVLHDLSAAWRAVADVNFSVQSLVTEPEMFHAFAPMEGIIAITIDVVIGQTSGLLSLALPSIFVKRLKHNFEHVRELGRSRVSEREHHRIKGLLQDVDLQVEVLIDAGHVSARKVVELAVGEVIVFPNCPMTVPQTAVVNGAVKLPGEVIQAEGRLLFKVGAIANSDAALAEKNQEVA